MGNICRKFNPGPIRKDYQLLTPSDDVQLEELQDFIDTTYKEFGVYKNDIISCQKDDEVIQTLLKLLPLYKKTKVKYETLDRYTTACPAHVKEALRIEHMKAKKILDTLDIVFLKHIIGEFSTCSEHLSQLLEKFTVDQTTLCDMEKIMNLIDIDEQNSKKLLIDINTTVEDESELLRQLPTPPTTTIIESDTKKILEYNLNE